MASAADPGRASYASMLEHKPTIIAPPPALNREFSVPKSILTDDTGNSCMKRPAIKNRRISKEVKFQTTGPDNVMTSSYYNDIQSPTIMVINADLHEEIGEEGLKNTDLNDFSNR